MRGRRIYNPIRKSTEVKVSYSAHPIQLFIECSFKVGRWMLQMTHELLMSKEKWIELE